MAHSTPAACSTARCRSGHAYTDISWQLRHPFRRLSDQTSGMQATVGAEGAAAHTVVVF